MTDRSAGFVDPPVIVCEPAGAAGMPLSDEERLVAAATFRRFGFLQVDGALPVALVDALRQACEEEDAQGSPTHATTVGDRRYLSAIEMSGPFNDPLVYANPRALPIVDDLLGGDTTLNSYCRVTARRGARAQHLHTDHPSLFPETALGALLPCYALTLIIPLVDVNAASGATAVWLGSHLQESVKASSRRDEDAYLPDAPCGSVYLMDYRLAHRGSANTTGHVRPILSLVYSRPWFVDSVNFRKTPRLSMTAATRAAIPERWRSLFVGEQWA